MAKVKKLSPRSSTRRCMVCDVSLLTCKHYISLKSTSILARVVLREQIERLLGDISDSSECLCDKCVSKFKNVQKSIDISNELKDRYRRTKEIHADRSVRPSSTISESSSEARGAKRSLAFSPVTPSSRHQTKKFSASVGSPTSTSKPTSTTHSSSRQDDKKKQLSASFGSPTSRPRFSKNNENVPASDPPTQTKMHSQDRVIHMTYLNQVRQELKELCRPVSKSAFREASLSNLQSYDIQQQALELKSKAPMFLSVLEAAAETPRGERNVVRTEESSVPKVVTAASILLNARSQNMNANQVMMALTLKEGCANKQTFWRLNTRGICTSYKTALVKQVECGTNYDEKVKQWARDVQDGCQKESSLDGDDRITFNETRADMPYTIVMDNVDIVVRARHPTRDNYGKDYHMVQMLAVKHRVSSYHLSSQQPTVSHQNVDSSKFLPTIQDDNSLRRDWMILCARMIGENIPSLKATMDALPSNVPHHHMREMSQKSEVVNLGVLMENENTTEGIYNIMHHMHQYSPGLTTILSAGDLLTCERESKCVEEQRNSSTPSQRLEGLMPVIADFHALANYYQVIWKQLYDPASSGDKGTLYSARNFLEARNVTTDPMKNVNAAADLIEKYTTALVISAAMDFFGLEDLEAEPTKNTFDLELHHHQKAFAEKTMECFVDKYMIPYTQEFSSLETSWSCQYCKQTFATRKTLLSHEKAKHRGLSTPVATVPIPENHQQDRVLNYTRCALGMCMLALDFTDARQMGDGERIVRLYKYFLLHFKAAKKTKYGYHTLRLLAQIKYLLSPRLSYDLVWNRFINTRGKPKCNVELDRVMEHHNRVFKEHARGLRGKITQDSVERVSRSAQTVHELLAKVDRQLEVRKASSKRTSTGRNDVAALAVDLHQENLFGEMPGRRHSAFPNCPVSAIGVLKVPDLHKYIQSTMKTLCRQNQFKPH